MSWKKCILIGVVLGSILGLAAYAYLWTVGNQLEAQDQANRVERQYEAINMQKHIKEPLRSSQDIYLGTEMVNDGDTYEVQHPQGYRLFQPTYAPVLGDEL